MNTTIALALLRQRLASPMRVLLLASAWLPPVGVAMLTLSLQGVSGTAYFMAAVLAAGAIGQDVSSGVLQLTFARPVRRSAYVLGRWFGAGAGGAALGIAQLAATAALLAARGTPPAAPELLAIALQQIVAGFTAAAVFVALSSLVGGLGDVALFALSTLGLQLASTIARVRGWTLARAALDESYHTLMPALDLGWIVGQGGPAWTGLVTALSTIALGLSVAIVVVNRKELSYAAD